jgi:flagellar basal body-associated protein FliL
MKRTLHSFLFPFVLAVFVMGYGESNAAEGGNKENESLYIKVAPILVNLHDQKHFLQTTMTLKVANPLLIKTVKANMPVILNELTYLLSDKDADQFDSPAGKQMLIQEARSAINKALSLTVKDGVTEIFLESLTIQ